MPSSAQRSSRMSRSSPRIPVTSSLEHQVSFSSILLPSLFSNRLLALCQQIKTCAPNNSFMPINKTITYIAMESLTCILNIK